MILLKYAVRSLGLCAALAVLTPFALAADGPVQAQALHGHYYLEGGPREVGSELLLKDGMRFEWGLMYGAQDLLAKGRWKLDGNRLVLTPVRPAPVFKLFDEADYARTKPAEPGTWIAVVGVPGVGPVDGIDVRFEARSGKTADAASKPNGDAIVRMPAGERWARAGLRADETQPWQWFTIPTGHAAARLVGFELTNVESMTPMPFKSLTLLVTPQGLVIADENADENAELHGTYVKH